MMTKSLLSPKFVEFREMVMGGEDLQYHFDKKTLITHSAVSRLKELQWIPQAEEKRK
jgi:allophanate hydrolase subunit 1